MPALDEAREAPQSIEAVRGRVEAMAETLPRRLRQCADYVLMNPERIAVSTVAELADEAGVQPSAFMRFCQALGFSGFSEMQRLYRVAYAQSWPDYRTRLDRLRDRNGGPIQLLHDFVAAGHKSLEILVEKLDLAALERAVALVRGASTIHVIGLRRSFPAASYLSYAFESMQIPVMLHGGIGGVDHRSAIRSGDALVAITVAPYSVETIELARHAAGLGIPVLGISDGAESPLQVFADESLTLKEVDVGAFRTLSATMTLAVTIAVAVGAARNAP